MARKRNNKQANQRATLVGRGDYASTVLGLKNPMQRLESKIDHLEKSLVKGPMSKKGAAGLIGRTLGNFAGQGDLGELAGSSLAKLFGHGDYKLVSNSIMGLGGGSSVPKFATPGRGVRVAEREFVGDILSGNLVSGSTEFDATVLGINPSNANLFPWLSRLAALYDQWEPNGIVLEFVSTSSEFNGASQALGAVIMATDYDPYDAPYATKQEMENSDFACSTKPSNGLAHGVECDPKERPTPILYVDSPGAPLTSTSLGNFTIATKGCSVADVVLGELWISYDITFYKKQIVPTLVTLPQLRASGNNGPLLGYWVSPIVDPQTRRFSITQDVGVGSVLNFNNIRAGERYQVEYYQTVDVVSSDGAVAWTVTNGSILSSFTEMSDPAGDELLTVMVIQSASGACTLNSDVRNFAASPAAYRILATEVSGDFPALS